MTSEPEITVVIRRLRSLRGFERYGDITSTETNAYQLAARITSCLPINRPQCGGTGALYS
jgi:hypothetical protein